MNEVAYPCRPIYRKDSNAAGIRDLHDRFYHKVFDYTLNKLNNQEESRAIADAYFVNLEQRFGGIERGEHALKKK